MPFDIETELAKEVAKLVDWSDQETANAYIETEIERTERNVLSDVIGPSIKAVMLVRLNKLRTEPGQMIAEKCAELEDQIAMYESQIENE